LRPGTAAAHELRGHVWRYVRKLPKAVPEYQKALEAEPDREEARKWLAVGLIEAGRYAEALVHLQKLLRAGDDLAMQTDLARCYRGLGQTDKARAALDAVLERDPEFGPALRVRGEVELAEAPAQAEAWLRKAVAAMPYDYSTHWVLLQTLLHQGKDADAKKQRAIVDELKERVERVSDLTTVKMPARPNDPALHCELGALLIGLGEKDSGRRWLMTALQHDPDYAPAHRVLADLYDREGDTELAGRHRQRAGS
jgi:tetratricopeptide (TPR) repeat protein